MATGPSIHEPSLLPDKRQQALMQVNLRSVDWRTLACACSQAIEQQTSSSNSYGSSIATESNKRLPASGERGGYQPRMKLFYVHAYMHAHCYLHEEVADRRRICGKCRQSGAHSDTQDRVDVLYLVMHALDGRVQSMVAGLEFTTTSARSLRPRKDMSTLSLSEQVESYF